jgi:hypothetical protein
MAWRDIWRGASSSGRELAVQEDDDGDIRAVATPRGDPSGQPLEIEPEDGESLQDALVSRGGFSVEEAVDIESHVEERRSA